jgi:hypothetical protein
MMREALEANGSSARELPFVSQIEAGYAYLSENLLPK